MKIALAHTDRLVREAVRRCLNQAGMNLLWAAANPSELNRMRRNEPPELLLLDAAMVSVAGLAESAGKPAFLVLSAGQDSPGVYEGLSAGALGQVTPPQLEPDGQLTGTARLLARIERIRGLVTARTAEQASTPHVDPKRKDQPLPVVALGASTGGPNALARVLEGLPVGLAAVVLIVQHIDGEYSKGFVEWLGTHCKIPVQLARSGELPEMGKVYVASTAGHLVLLPSRQLGYQAASREQLHVPSVDVLFESLAVPGATGVAALLSGMGSDGARGLMGLRRAGWHTVAQDQNTSTVYGMPRAAVEMGAATQSLALGEIAGALLSALSSTRARSA